METWRYAIYEFLASGTYESHVLHILASPITQAVKALVSSGANINARTPESKNHTALHEAVIGGHKDVAKYLLDMGANQV
jgi:ankyrin repeat protein